MTMPHLIAAKRGKPGDDPIFALNAEANRRKAAGEPVVNATLGALQGDDGKLSVLPTAARAMREVPAAEFAAYAPIAGPEPFLAAVADDVLGAGAPRRSQVASCATPGGTGALRHAIACFLEPGQALLCTSFYWGPYATLAEETGRKLATFRMFSDDTATALDAADLDRALGDLATSQGRALVILNDPCHNPTGYSMSAADWQAVSGVLLRHAERMPVTLVLDAAYAAFGPPGAMRTALAALDRIGDRVLVLHAWSASKSMTHYGARVGALLAVVPDEAARKDVAAALAFACRGTWSNCNRGGMHAVTRLLADPATRAAVDAERAGLTSLLASRVEAFNAEARRHGLRYPRYDGGFFVTVFCAKPKDAAARMREEGVFVVPVDGGLRVGICSVAAGDVPRLVSSMARALG
ncbi:MAG: Aromatic-amino-acid aminotransferase [Planctomycetes bacterium]|nr:Aromatic-amino-acid aminotransferase [Planctomycetota bacterium]